MDLTREMAEQVMKMKLLGRYNGSGTCCKQKNPDLHGNTWGPSCCKPKGHDGECWFYDWGSMGVEVMNGRWPE
jgi:hypothetical protein